MTDQPEITIRVKRPVEVHTLEWTGDNPEQVIEFCGTISGRRLPVFQPPIIRGGTASAWNSEEHCWVDVPIGHHLVRGALGEYYPISPAALEATYTLPEPADPVDGRAITPTVARHVLAHFSAGGYPAGSFTRALIALMAAADPANAHRLRRVFPAYSVAVHMAQNTHNGITQLRYLADPPEPGTRPAIARQPKGTAP